jgi:hypothetical protein
MAGRKTTDLNRLSFVNPDLLSQWHPTRNEKLNPSELSRGSGKKVWWKCQKGTDHEWEAAISSRVNGNGCPFCSNRKVSKTNSLSLTNPELAEQWNYAKNDNLTPNDLTNGSHKKVWWTCSKNSNHIWEAIVYDRVKGKKCPICAGQKTDITNCLATIYPIIAEEWHPTKNKNLTPFDVTSKSNKKVWWKCKKGEDHEWFVPVHNRADGYGCPVCTGQKVVLSNSLATISPQIAIQWHPTKNGNLTPYDVTNVSGKVVWWQCNKNEEHEWKTTIAHRVNGRNCPICGNKKVILSNSLKSTHPQLMLEWDFNRNREIIPESVVAGSDKSVWWKCSKGDDHQWKAKIGERTAGNSCPICAGRKVVLSNCLATLNPKIASEWHPTKNKKLTPYDVTLHTRKKVWWKCPKGEDHEWSVSIDSRKNGKTGCPICSNRKVVLSNCLQNRFPSIAKEWDFQKNGLLNPNKVVWGSNKKVFWICSNNEQHKWKTTIVARTLANSGCPFCTVFPQSKDELIILFELKLLFNEIDVKGQRIRINNKVLAVDIFIKSLNLAIEFDGSYWHKDKFLQDKEKSDLLLKGDIQTIRIRQNPLTKTAENDIFADKKVNYKKVLNDILGNILKNYTNKLSTFQIEQINDYLHLNDLLNISKAQKYIEKKRRIENSKTSNSKKEIVK